MRELSQEERLSEITYLIALLVEKVWWTKKYITKDK
jgi:hypothetical protein